MNRTPIQSPKAPAAIGPYSQAIATDTLLFTSGTLAIDPKIGTIPEGTIEEHAHQVFRNLAAVAEAAGTNLSRAIKVTVYLTDMADFNQVNAVYSHYFQQPYPARSAVEVAALPLGADIEVEAVLAL
ncbi:endoribonuclease L-PSP [Desulfobulbus propionicus DSM 2032]|uniref:Endoribonuclease L-PSP n=1 Tax=Desulfobulbus propionicus (strain ATCC 33891 / DSM 2032 / VKM B-1956 / 1pr3) TaxID=577650 RepID=A0A7U4DNA4_DESPD|nr:RidA family protein [Desulfobulbus propionicus]ADW16906.1 endoribonuclease L-PSP [Desulfobulbus propionicus DSM 2032]